MSDLSKLPNVGKVLEKLLVEARSLAVLISDGKKIPLNK